MYIFKCQPLSPPPHHGRGGGEEGMRKGGKCEEKISKMKVKRSAESEMVK
jgi:hypothetical protein